MGACTSKKASNALNPEASKKASNALNPEATGDEFDDFFMSNPYEDENPPEGLEPTEDKLVLMLCGDFLEDYSAMVPFQALQAYGYTVHAVCPNKTAEDKVSTAIHDFEDDPATNLKYQTYTEKKGHNFALNFNFEDVNVETYTGLVIPGGRSPEYLSTNQAVCDLVKAFVDADKPIASVFNGQLILAAVGGLEGKTCTAFPGCKTAIEKGKGTWQVPNEQLTLAMNHGNLVTAAAWPGQPEMLKQFGAKMGMKAYKTKKKVLFLCGDYMEDYEVMVPYQTLLGLWYAVDTVCPGKDVGERCFTAVHDFEGHQTYTEKPGHFFELNEKFEGVTVDDYDGLLIPGGRAPEYLAMNEKVLELVRAFVTAEKPIASVCHGQQILVAADVLEGKKCTAYPAVKPQVLDAGAEWIEPEPISLAFTDGNLITAAAWPGHPEFLKQFYQALGTTVII